MTERSFDEIAAELRKLKASEEALTARESELIAVRAAKREDLARVEFETSEALEDLAGDLASVRSNIQAATQALRDVKVTAPEPAAEPAAEDKEEGLETAPVEAEAKSVSVSVSGAAEDGFRVNPFTGLTHRTAS